MRIAKRWSISIIAGEPRHGVHGRDFARLLIGELWKQPGEASREHSLAGARRAHHQQVMTASGGVMPLGALATLHETVDSAQLRRVDGHRTVTLRIIPPRAVALETAVAPAVVAVVRDHGQFGTC